MSNGILTEMTIEDVRAFDPEVVAIGVASVEPHGPVLPYGTDYWQADAIVRRGVILANEAGAKALMYPTLPIGNNANLKAFPFACRIGVQTLMQMLLDIINALAEDGINKIVLFDNANIFFFYTHFFSYLFKSSFIRFFIILHVTCDTAPQSFVCPYLVTSL